MHFKQKNAILQLYQFFDSQYSLGFEKYDYYPFGMIMPGRKYQASPSSKYRYSINGQEKESELNENITTALYWEYESRIGRRWNVDPVPKGYQSLYSCFTNNPIWRIDPDGDDDIFNEHGQFIRRTNNGSTKIIIETAKGNFLYSKLPVNNEQNKQILANIAGYYAHSVGVKDNNIGVGYRGKKSEDVPAYSSKKGIFVNIQGGVYKEFDDYNNLMSAMDHERFHKIYGHDYIRNLTNYAHANVYLDQIASKFFEKTTTEFKSGLINSVENILNKAIAEGESSLNIGTMVDNFNKHSKTTGYKFTLYEFEDPKNPDKIGHFVVAESLPKKKKR